MAIIFGWGGGTPRDQGPAIPVPCPNCGNSTFYRYFIVRKWFRLYFIPILPYETRHLLVCPVCTSGRELHGEQRQRARQMVELTASWSGGLVADDQYMIAVTAFLDERPIPAFATHESQALEVSTNDPLATTSGLRPDETAPDTAIRFGKTVESNNREVVSQEPRVVGAIQTPAASEAGAEASSHLGGERDRYCTSRGALAGGGARFCHQCGATLLREGE